MSKHDIFPIPSYFVQAGAEECVFGSQRKLKVSVLSANLKKYRFCNFSGSYTKPSPSEWWSWTKTYSVIVTGASWVHFNPNVTYTLFPPGPSIGVFENCSSRPFFQRLSLLFVIVKYYAWETYLFATKL